MTSTSRTIGFPLVILLFYMFGEVQNSIDFHIIISNSENIREFVNPEFAEFPKRIPKPIVSLRIPLLSGPGAPNYCDFEQFWISSIPLIY